MDRLSEKEQLEIAEKLVEFGKENIVVPREHYEKLLADSRLLESLHQFGVDNWSGYCEARAEFQKHYE